MLIWIDKAPSIVNDPNNKIETFVDKYISCSKNQSIATLVNYQTHRHA